MKLNSQLVERAKEIKERKEELWREENEYRGFHHTYGEARANRDKWQREMIGITYGDRKKNYYHVGGYILHPWKPWVLAKYPKAKSGWDGHDNLASFDLSFNEEFSSKDSEWYKDFFDFTSKNGRSELNDVAAFHGEYSNYPLINVRHSETVKYKITVTRERDGYRREPDPIRYTGQFMEAEDSSPMNAKKTYWEQLTTLLENTEDLYPSWQQGFITEKAFKLSEEDIIKFQKIYASCRHKLIEVLPFTDKKQWAELEQDKIKYEQKKAEELLWEQQAPEREIEEDLEEDEEDDGDIDFRKLYLMKDKRNGFYKIGISDNPKYRERTWQSEKPEIELVGDWKDLSDYERDWHKYFDNERQRGEWFKLTKTQVKFFVSQCLKGNAPPEKTAV